MRWWRNGYIFDHAIKRVQIFCWLHHLRWLEYEICHFLKRLVEQERLSWGEHFRWGWWFANRAGDFKEIHIFEVDKREEAYIIQYRFCANFAKKIHIIFYERFHCLSCSIILPLAGGNNCLIYYFPKCFSPQIYIDAFLTLQIWEQQVTNIRKHGNSINSLSITSQLSKQYQVL